MKNIITPGRTLLLAVFLIFSNCSAFAAPPLVTSSSQTNISCNGLCDGTATVVATGGVGPYTYSWAPSGGTASTASGLCAGTYTVTVTDATFATETVTFSITQPAALSASNCGQLNVSCFGGTNGNARVCATGGTGVYSYDWSPGTPNGDSTFAISNIQAGTWTVLVTDANGCSVTQSYTITQPSALALTGSHTNVSCNGGNNGSATVSASGATPPYTYSWAPSGGTTATASSLSAGNYTVTVTDSLGCTATRSYNITQPAALSITASQTNVSCNGAANGSGTAVVSGGTGAYTYSWLPTGGSGATATLLSPGTYTLNVSDANACTTSQTYTITEPAVLTATGSQTNPACNGSSTGSASVTVMGGTPSYTYSWAPAGGTSATASGLTAGNYTVTVTDANGCNTTQSFTLSEPTAISVSETHNNVSCNGGANGSASVSASGGTGGYTYSWAPSGGTGSSATGLSAGNYTVTITDASGCTSTAIINISQPAALTTTGTLMNVSCNGATNGSATVAASGGTPAYSYNWLPGSPTGDGTTTITNLAAGSYTVIVTDANGCNTFRNYTITEPAGIVTTPSQTNVTCPGGSNGTATVSATGGAGSLSYDWSPGSPSGDGTPAITGLSAGTYTVTIMDGNSCSKDVVYTITQPAALTVSVSPVNATCSGSANGTASVVATGGTGTLSYNWGPGSPTGDGSTSITNLSAGSYDVIVTDANGCSSTALFTISAPSAITASSVTNNPSCFGGTNGNISITATGGAGSYTYDWSPGTPAGEGTSAISSLPAGTYSVLVTDGNGCSNTFSYTLSQPAAITTTGTSNNVSCGGGSNGSASVTAAGGTGAFTYDWSPGTPTGDGTPSISGLAAGSYTVLVTDANGCTATRTFTITSPPAVSITTTTSSVSCNGGSNGSAVATASGGSGTYFYSWSPAGGTAATASGLSAGTYTVTVTDGSGCTATATAVITQPTAISFSSSQSNVLCFGQSNGSAAVVASGGTGTIAYSWTPGGASTSSVSGLAPGTYTITMTDANSCTAITTINITQPPALSISGTFSDNLCAGGNTGSASVTVSGGSGTYSYDWLPGSPAGDGTSTITSLAAGSYTVNVTDANGCTISTTFSISSPSALAASTTQNNASCFGGNDGSASVLVTGGTGAISYSWSPSGGSSATANSLAAGTYTVTATDANSCSIQQVVTITQPAALTASFTSGSIACNGGSTSVAISAAGGTLPYTGIGSFTQTAAATNYVVTDAEGCSTMITVSLPEPAAITVTGSAGTILCAGGSTTVTITASGGTGTLSGTGTFTQSAGTVSYIVTDVNGCSASTNITVTAPAAVVANYTSGTIQCNGGSTSVTITGSGGTAPYMGEGTFVQSAGTTTYMISDANGCSSSVAVALSEPALLNAVATTAGILCAGETANVIVTATGGTGPYSNTGSFTQSTGTTVYNISDANGCMASTSVTVSEPAVLLISASSGTILCNGGTATIMISASGGTPVYSGTGSFLQAAGSTTYTVTDANGCTADTTIALTEPSPIVITATQSALACFGDTATVTITASGGTGPYSGEGTFLQSAGTNSYTLTDNNGCTSNLNVTVTQPAAISSSASVTICSGDTLFVGSSSYNVSGTYTDILTSAAGCDSTHTTFLTVRPAISSFQNLMLCAGDTVTVGSSSYFTTGVYTDVLLSYTGCDSTVTTVVNVSPVIAKTISPEICAGDSFTVGTNIYTVSGVYTDVLTAMNGCDSTVTTNLTVHPYPVVTILPFLYDTICFQEFGMPLNTGTPAGGTYTGPGVLPGMFNPSIAGLGTHTITYTYAGPGGCTSSATREVTVDDCTGIEEVSENGTMEVYPNPASEMLTIQFESDASTVIRITDMKGALVYQRSVSLQGTVSEQIEVSDLPKGVYVVWLEKQQTTQKRKLIIQ